MKVIVTKHHKGLHEIMAIPIGRSGKEFMVTCANCGREQRIDFTKSDWILCPYKEYPGTLMKCMGGFKLVP